MKSNIKYFFYHISPPEGHDKECNKAKKYADKNLPKDPGSLENYEAQLGKLIQIFTNSKVMKKDGRAIQEHAFAIIPEEKIKSISYSLLKSKSKKAEHERDLIWQYHKDNYHCPALNLRPLFSAISFEDNGDLKDLFKAYRFWIKLKKDNKKLSDYMPSRIPMNHIRPKSLQEKFKQTINTRKGPRCIVNSHQYEFYLYRALRENIRQRKVVVNSSTDYKSFANEAKIPKNWDKTKSSRLKLLNNKILLKPIDTILDELECILEPLIERTNSRIFNGENKDIKLKTHRDGRISWTLPYPNQNTEIDNPFYEKLEPKTISELYDFVENDCNFMKAFTHLKPHSSSNDRDYLATKGAILANGTMQGTYLFSKRSNLKYNRLKKAEESCIRINTLRSAADIIIDKMIALPVFELYLLNDKLHGSVDGKKKKTRRRLLKARYSSKYFGTDVGLVLMTMGVGHVPFATQIIGANEHESHFVFPMQIQNNNVVDPDIISTDTAGTNNLNDLLYYLSGKIHAPCYRSIVSQADKICGFKALSKYKGYVIKPEKTLNKKLIRKNWPKMLPILHSLLSHDSKQENIIRQLSSHDYNSEVKDALWELNRVLKSIHILKYIDNPQYRRNIRTALNRGEAYHQLLDKIAAVGGGDFRGMSDMEVEIWNESMRFVALLIIYYNMTLLSKLLEINQGNEEAIAYLTSISPVASQHLNINGLYEFSEERAEIDVEKVVALMDKILEEALQKAQKGKSADSG